MFDDATPTDPLLIFVQDTMTNDAANSHQKAQKAQPQRRQSLDLLPIVNLFRETFNFLGRLVNAVREKFDFQR